MHTTRMRSMFAAIAPGTELRDGLNRILAARTGAIILLGWNDEVHNLTSGGFQLDVPFTAPRLRELSKMDGAIIIDLTNKRIRGANLQLMPDSRIETRETGMRHRTAERVAKQTGFPVISVSQSMGIIAMYLDGHRHVIEDPDTVANRARQALDTLERYRERLNTVNSVLTTLEMEDTVTARDVAVVVQRTEMLHRIQREIGDYVAMLGTDGRLIALQLEELLSGVEDERQQVVRDYVDDPARRGDVLQDLNLLEASELARLPVIARVLGIAAGEGADLSGHLTPRGYRVLGRIARLTQDQVETITGSINGLQQIIGATHSKLAGLVGPHAAALVRDGLYRLAESAPPGSFK